MSARIGTIGDTINHGIEGLRFYIGNQEGNNWYNPPKSYALLEYRWVLDNIAIKGRRVMDVGAHHGHYAVVFRGASRLVCVEPVAENVAILKQNMTLNNVAYEIAQVRVGYDNLPGLMPDAQVVKLDIEGDEFKALPGAIDLMPDVTDWIVECHPGRGNPNIITNAFIERGFEVLKVYIDRMCVDVYKPEVWNRHGTIIARKL